MPVCKTQTGHRKPLTLFEGLMPIVDAPPHLNNDKPSRPASPSASTSASGLAAPLPKHPHKDSHSQSQFESQPHPIPKPWPTPDPISKLTVNTTSVALTPGLNITTNAGCDDVLISCFRRRLRDIDVPHTGTYICIPEIAKVLAHDPDENATLGNFVDGARRRYFRKCEGAAKARRAKAQKHRLHPRKPVTAYPHLGARPAAALVLAPAATPHAPHREQQQGHHHNNHIGLETHTSLPPPQVNPKRPLRPLAVTEQPQPKRLTTTVVSTLESRQSTPPDTVTASFSTATTPPALPAPVVEPSGNNSERTGRSPKARGALGLVPPCPSQSTQPFFVPQLPGSATLLDQNTLPLQSPLPPSQQQHLNYGQYFLHPHDRNHLYAEQSFQFHEQQLHQTHPDGHQLEMLRLCGQRIYRSEQQTHQLHGHEQRVHSSQPRESQRQHHQDQGQNFIRQQHREPLSPPQHERQYLAYAQQHQPQHFHNPNPNLGRQHDDAEFHAPSPGLNAIPEAGLAPQGSHLRYLYSGPTIRHSQGIPPRFEPSDGSAWAHWVHGGYRAHLRHAGQLQFELAQVPSVGQAPLFTQGLGPLPPLDAHAHRLEPVPPLHQLEQQQQLQQQQHQFVHPDQQRDLRAGTIRVPPTQTRDGPPMAPHSHRRYDDVTHTQPQQQRPLLRNGDTTTRGEEPSSRDAPEKTRQNPRSR